MAEFMHPTVSSANVAKWKKEWDVMVSKRLRGWQQCPIKDKAEALRMIASNCSRHASLTLIGEPILSLPLRICMYMCHCVNRPVLKKTHNAEQTMRERLIVQ
jgi:hypothetical protein